MNFLKIDAEGAEADVLIGGMEAIGRFRPIIQLETTISGDIPELPGYVSYRAKKSPNMVMFPAESSDAQGHANELGWERI